MKGGGELDKTTCPEDILNIIENIQNTPNLISAFEGYSPKSNMVVIDDFRNNENTKIKRYKDCVYFGQFINGKRHGQGTLFILILILSYL